MPNWAEQVTAIATAVSALGLLSAIGAVIFAGQQAREARINRQAEMAAEFFRRWSESPMVETRRFVAQFETPEALRDAMTRYIAENSAEAYVLYRELDYFEQLGALEKHGGFDFELIRTLLGRQPDRPVGDVAAVDRCNRRKCRLPDVRKARDKNAAPPGGLKVIRAPYRG